jgi:hypothetical protein
MPSPVDDLDISAIRQRCTTSIGSEFYSHLSHFSSYGPRFQRVSMVYLGEREALVTLRGLDETLSRSAVISSVH